jgi:glycosyltransferase involved in cell wall biosynthesis
MPPKISIVTPSYNQASYIEQTIDSILSQGYPDLEYVVIDGGSTDGSVDIIRKYSKHLTYWISEKDGGQSHAINKGHKRLTGEVFNWINSDDFLQPDALKIIAENFQDPQTKVLLAKGNIIRDGKIVRQSTGTDVYRNNLPKTIGFARIDQPETWFRKTVFDTLMPVSTTLHYVMDKDLWIRCLLQFGLNGIKQIPDRLVNFRIHSNSKTSSQQHGFLTETNLLYYQLAKLNGCKAEANFIKEHFAVSDQVIALPSTVNDHLIRSALHYFLLLTADTFYFNSEFDNAKAVLDFIDSDLLEEADKKQLQKLKFRSRPVMRSVIKQIRKWR